MPGKFKLIYFNSRGRAETTRMIFAQGGIEYEDVRCTQEEWQKYKPSKSSKTFEYSTCKLYRFFSSLGYVYNSIRFR